MIVFTTFCFSAFLVGKSKAFQSPLPVQIASSRVFLEMPYWDGIQCSAASCRHRTNLYISPSTDNEKEDFQDLATTAMESNGHDSQLVEWAVQGSILLAITAFGYTLASTVLSAAGDIAISAVGALGDEFLREINKIISSLATLLCTLAVSVLDGLIVAIPFIAKAVIAGVQVAIPVLKDASETVSEFAAPYVDEATSEIAVVAAPYVDHLKIVVHQATDSMIVEPVQHLSRTMDTTIVAPLQSAKDTLLETIDVTVVAPMQEVKDTMTSAIDSNLVSPMQEVKDTVAIAIDKNLMTPIHDVKDSVTDTVDSKLIVPIQEAKESLGSIFGISSTDATKSNTWDSTVTDTVENIFSETTATTVVDQLSTS